jgi:hypothetical protein
MGQTSALSDKLSDTIGAYERLLQQTDKDYTAPATMQ